MTIGELRAAVRAQGHASFGNIDAVVLETDGTFSVITAGWGDSGAMGDVEGVGERRRERESEP